MAIRNQSSRGALLDDLGLHSLLAGHWRIGGELSELGSFEGGNVVVDDGARRFVVRISDEGADPAALELAANASRSMAESGLPYEVPEPIPTTDDPPAEALPHGARHISVVTWIEGTPLSSLPHLDAAALTGLGQLTADTVRALEAIPPPSPSFESEWDPRRAAKVLADVLPDLPGEEGGPLERAIEPLEHVPEEIKQALPTQVIHGDITDYNVLCRPAGSLSMRPTGLIDFGDVVHTWRICEVANVCVAVAAREPDDPLKAILPVLTSYRRAIGATDAEAEVLWPLILARAGASAALSLQRLQLTPDSQYLRVMNAGDRAALQALTELPDGLGRATSRVALGHAPACYSEVPTNAVKIATPLIRDLDLEQLSPLDLSLTTELFDAGHTELPGPPAIGRWGETRLTDAGRPSQSPPPTLHLGADLFVRPGTPVRAPVEASVARTNDNEIVLRLETGIHLRLAGLTPAVSKDQTLDPGDVLGAVAVGDPQTLPPHLHVQLCPSPDFPGLGRARPAEREAWLALCPDPSPLLGVNVAAPQPVSDDESRRQDRDHAVASPQKLYYERPTEIVRGWRQYLYDATGRPYLDMINNVAAVGHSHPRITEAASRQLKLLNTNSRFLYASMARYAERILELLPGELERVFFVNSGSEACDLALQLARVYTGRTDVVAIEGAYHGWTEAVYELCTSPQDNPPWHQTIPPFVHVAEQPDPYRGVHENDTAEYVASVHAQIEKAAANNGLAAFISEPLLGNQGAVEPPPGYLKAAYEVVREHGGLCIADEIQVGYARTGENFWAFEHEQVVPDIVLAAKAAGNGHPIGIVACRAELAEALGRRASFFSSTAGSPVTCEIGLAVLDVIRDEGLQENAQNVGRHLKTALEELAERHPTIGMVNGRGLYQGVDLVDSQETKEPAPQAAHAVCERMLELGVIVQPTGDAANVLKVKPPMCLTTEDADYFTATLDQALSEIEAIRAVSGP